jgi:hypothetical protein
MAKIGIPEDRREGLSLIQRLSTAATYEISALLQKSPGNSLTNATALRPSSSFATLTAEEVKSLLVAVIELYRVRADRDVSVQEFATGVVDAMVEIEEVDLRIPESGREEFEQKLLVLLGAEKLSLISKAKNLASEDERSFCDARIITDVRPVFPDTPQTSPTSMVIVQRLRIEYHVGGSKHKDLYIAVDADDLKRLQSVISRAQAEAKSLESALEEFHLFGVEESETK